MVGDYSMMDLTTDVTHNGMHHFPDNTVHSVMLDQDGELGQLSLEIEKERSEYQVIKVHQLFS
jgi:hypothetical protein